MTTIITDHDLYTECADIARDVFREVFEENYLAKSMGPGDWESEMDDRINEVVDGHAFVIYTHNALSICAHCNTDAGEEFVDDVGLPKPFTLASAASAIAYGEMTTRARCALKELVDNWEAPEGWFDD